VSLAVLKVERCCHFHVTSACPVFGGFGFTILPFIQHRSDKPELNARMKIRLTTGRVALLILLVFADTAGFSQSDSSEDVNRLYQS
jgi:hypothetical protein